MRKTEDSATSPAGMKEADMGSAVGLRKHKRLQVQQDRLDARKKSPRKNAKRGDQRAAPGPGHEEPEPPMPGQHLTKPGIEAETLRRFNGEAARANLRRNHPP